MSETNLAITLMFAGVDLTDERVLHRVIDRLMDLFPEGDPLRPKTLHMALSKRPFSDLEERIGGWATRPGEEGSEMGIVKHGEGSILPENEQQKTAAQQSSGLSAEAAEELRRENEEADVLRDDE